MSSLTSPRPKRHCRSRSALELLSGADLPELDAVPKRSGTANSGAEREQGGPSSKTGKSKNANLPAGLRAERGVHAEVQGISEVKSPTKRVNDHSLHTSMVSGNNRDVVDDGDIVDAAYVTAHFVDPKMLVLLGTIGPSDTLERHFAAVTKRGGKNGMKCKYCSTIYQSRPEFLSHLQMHSTQYYNPWRCTLCPFVAVFRSSLAVHLNMHAEKKPVACDLCGRGFESKQKLRQHSAYHAGAQNQICTYCGHIFDDPENLRFHINSDHSGVTELMTLSWVDKERTTAIVEMVVDPAVSETTDQPATDAAAITENRTESHGVLALQAGSDLAHASASYSDVHTICTKEEPLDAEEADESAADDAVVEANASDASAQDDMDSSVAPAMAQGGDDMVVVDPQVCYAADAACYAGAGGDAVAAAETEDERIAVMALEALEAEGASANADDTGYAGTAPAVYLHCDATTSSCEAVMSSEAAMASAEAMASAVTTVAPAAPAGFDGHAKEMLEEHEIVLQITRVDRDAKDFLGTKLAQRSNTLLISLPVDGAGGKSLVAGSKRSKAPIIIGTSKAAKKSDSRRSDGLSPLPTTSGGPVPATVIVDDSNAAGITVDIVDASGGEDGGNCSSSDAGSKSMSGGKMEIDDVLLEYCSFDDGADKPGKKPTINCMFCEYPFRSQTSFTNHLRKAHGDMNIKPYKCHLCEYRAALKGNLEQHIKFHAQERPFTCHVCNKGFIQKYKLDLHLKFHENRREYKCDKCGSAFNDKQDLSRHNKNVHFPIATAVMCEICGKAFKNKRNLDMHTHVHTGAKEFSCEVCGKQYSTRESLRSHMKGHQFQFGCEICAKPLGSYSAFIAHKRLHDPNQKGYECDVCGKVLLFRATLEAHRLNVHSTERPFKCDQCPKAFKTKGQLMNHVISHSKDKPYTCEVCGYSVKRRDSLRLHMYRHAQVKPYRCGRCGKEYTQKQALEIHLKAKHAGITTYNCSHCDKGFNTNYLLKKHMQKAHNLDVGAAVQAGAGASGSEQVIIAKQEESIEELEAAAAAVKKQTVLINAHICEHCSEVFVSQHALAVHILTDHMNQQKWLSNEAGIQVAAAAGSAPTSVAGEDGQVVSIDETIEIPIGEEMLIVQTVQAADTVPGDSTQNELLDKAPDAVIVTGVTKPTSP